MSAAGVIGNCPEFTGLPFDGWLTTHIEFEVEIPNSEDWPEVTGNYDPLVRFLNLPVSQTLIGAVLFGWASVYLDNALKPGIWHFTTTQTPNTKASSGYITGLGGATKYDANHRVDTFARVGHPDAFDDVTLSYGGGATPSVIVYDDDFEAFGDITQLCCSAFDPLRLGVSRIGNLDEFFTTDAYVIWSWLVNLEADWVSDPPP